MFKGSVAYLGLGCLGPECSAILGKDETYTALALKIARTGQQSLGAAWGKMHSRAMVPMLHLLRPSGAAFSLWLAEAGPQDLKELHPGDQRASHQGTEQECSQLTASSWECPSVPNHFALPFGANVLPLSSLSVSQTQKAALLLAFVLSIS